MDWARHVGVRLAAGTIQSDHVTSEAECINNCAMSSVCDSINFRSTDKSCQLVGQIHPENDLDLSGSRYVIEHVVI